MRVYLFRHLGISELQGKDSENFATCKRFGEKIEKTFSAGRNGRLLKAPGRLDWLFVQIPELEQQQIDHGHRNVGIGQIEDRTEEVAVAVD